MRFKLPLAATLLALVAVQSASAQPGSAPRVMFRPAPQRAITADVVVVGKVMSIEKDAVEVAGTKRTPRASYRVALVKVEDPLAGVAGLTQMKVGFVPPTNSPVGTGGPNGLVRPAIARFGGLPELKEGQELVLFLSKHPTTGLHILTSLSPPIDTHSPEAKVEIAQVKKVTAVLADPMKSLRAEKTEDRYFAALVVIAKYRSPPELGEVEATTIPAAESNLILKGLVEGDWSKNVGGIVGGESAIAMLGVQEKDGWMYPKLKSGQNRVELVQAAFVEWFKGPGKEYLVRKYVLKKK